MKVVSFTCDHIVQARELALMNYCEERQAVPVLPRDIDLDLTSLALNGIGVSAFVQDKLVGFLCFHPPNERVFTSQARGVYCPLHGHGAVKENREKIYKHMYIAAAEKLALLKVSSHSITLYAHDSEVENAFFTLGFGMRCIDAVRPMDGINPIICSDYTFGELSSCDKNLLLPLKNKLIDHLGASPSFMYYPYMDEQSLEVIHTRRGSQYFCAWLRGEMVAFLEVMDRGENFACDHPKMKNICGAYCLADHRGRGVFHSLLNYVILTLSNDGYSILGVDFESFNPTAYGFWLKYFSDYTHSLARRCDEQIMDR